MKKAPLGLVLVVAFAGLAIAHGTGEHVRGTVAKVDASHVEVATTGGKTVSVALTKDTKYFKKKTPATLTDLKEGLRVVIDATRKGEALEATEVKIGVGKKKIEEAK